MKSLATLTAPTAVQLDASAHCQLACPLCPTADGRTRPGMGQGHLAVENFRDLLDRNPEIAHVELSNYGEMFLNPRLIDLLRCAHEHGVTVSGGNGVNLNHARPQMLRAVVDYGVRTLTCSLDGATPETYAKYRVNGDLERVLANIDVIREYKRERRSAFPLLDWQFVVFGHNEHELETARGMAASRGMGFLPRLSWDDEFSPVRDEELVQITLGGATRDEFREKQGRGYTRDICYQLWRQPVLNWDGRVMGCCVNHWQDFGSNAFDDGFAAAVNNPKLNHARDMLMGRALPRDDIPCTSCHHYDEIREAEDWLTDDEIAGASGPGRIGGVLLEGHDGGAKFAQVSVTEGHGSAPPRRPSGRIFRFGVDAAVYFHPAAGPFSVHVRALGGSGWEPLQTWRFEATERPLVQQWRLDLNQPPAAETACEPPGRETPVWMR